jgi:glycosyltransferase involved in cell wall biosynthesis
MFLAATIMAPSVRILHISEILRGGVGSYLEEVLPYQANKLGKENVLLLAPEDQAKYLPPRITSTAEFYHRTGRNFLSLVRLWRAAQNCIERYKPNVVHLHSSLAGGVIRLLLTGRQQRPKIVYCPHAWAFKATHHAPLQHLYAAIERHLVHETDMIINVSRAEANSAATVGLPPKKLAVILNGISSSIPQSNFAIKFEPSNINLLFAGRHDRQKGLDLLIEAMKQVLNHRIHLHIIGDSSSSHFSKENYGLPNITTYGWVARADVSAYIHASDAVIMPSRYEGLPLVAIEALRMGRPVIASECDGLTEVVVNGETGILFPPNDIQAMVNTLKSLDYFRLENMRLHAAQQFQQNFTSDRMNSQLLDLYSTLIDGSETSVLAKLVMHTLDDRDRKLQPIK